MNRMTKGALAGAAGVALLMGGFGTYATWTDDAALDDKTVTSGSLRLDPEGTSTPVWTDVSSGTPVAIADISSFDMVPGDELRVTQVLEVEAVGQNIAGEISVAGPTVVGAELAEQVDVTMSLEGSGRFEAVGNVYEFTGALDETVTAVATITYEDLTAVTQNGSMSQSVSLEDMVFTVTQTR